MRLEIEPARWLLRRAMQTQGENFIYLPGGNGTCIYRPMTPREAGDATDPRCLTGCLVGVALDLWGEARHRGSKESVSGLSQAFPDMMSSRTVKYFGVAQRVQDVGAPWGTAYAAAERWYYMQ